MWMGCHVSLAVLVGWIRLGYAWRSAVAMQFSARNGKETCLKLHKDSICKEHGAS